MSKIALVLHGWPQTKLNQYFLVKFLEDKDYEVVIPNLYLIEESWDIGEISDKISDEIKGRCPDLIVGILMGGLILPHIAKRCPKSKLIFIASGAYFKPDLLLTKLGMVILKKKLLRRFLVNIGNNIPLSMIGFLYSLFNPFTGEEKDREIYEKDMKLNLNEIKKHSFSKHLMLLDLVCKIDNRKLLSTIRNTALIFDGENDRLMGGGGKEISKFLENSKLIVNKGEHFNVFDKRDLTEVKKFLQT